MLVAKQCRPPQVAPHQSHRAIDEDKTGELAHIDAMLLLLTKDDMVHRWFLASTHRAYVPDFGVYIRAEVNRGKIQHFTVSRQMVLFCVERRKAWRVLQSRVGLDYADYKRQRALLRKVDEGEIPLDAFLAGSSALFAQEQAG